MNLPVVTTPEADAQIHTIAVWWRRNRTAGAWRTAPAESARDDAAADEPPAESFAVDLTPVMARRLGAHLIAAASHVARRLHGHRVWCSSPWRSSF